MKSLIVLAKENNLPDYQYMDSETLQWIINNPPQIILDSNKDNPIINIELINKFIPKREWFIEAKITDSIHGIRHSGRCLAHTINIHKKTPSAELMIAVALHDIGRKNDKNDPGHGERGVLWLENNLDVVLKNIRIKEIDSRTVINAIKYHEIPYEDIPDNIINNSKGIIDILKTSDTLDRYIQPKLNWRINDNFLMNKPTDSQKLFAYNLVIQVEKNFISGLSSEEAVMQALQSYEVR